MIEARPILRTTYKTGTLLSQNLILFHTVPFFLFSPQRVVPHRVGTFTVTLAIIVAIHTAAAPRSPAASARVDIDEASTATVNEWRWHMFMKN